jgi:hypothetical protein
LNITEVEVDLAGTEEDVRRASSSGRPCWAKGQAGRPAPPGQCPVNADTGDFGTHNIAAS